MDSCKQEALHYVAEHIKEHYRLVFQIGRLEMRLEQLNKSLKTVENRIENSQITLTPTFPIHIYDQSNVKGSRKIHSSQQEKALEKAFTDLENQLQDIQCQIIKTHGELLEAELKTADLEYIISRLPDEQQRILRMKYQQGYTLERIGLELNLSRSIVHMKLKKILMDIYDLISDIDGHV